ncbi:PhzF family phenazine biosynthesis protein [Cellulomonas sp. PhB143]|uniref:PhzF family phenazine biosynthesis protein n=1 Tax=Cellulomonas sp. PhB143 TaxID=2485186 RepID=UPI000F462497|nr:PhzF family phenazine biosynthesis protein [Cellulomonas sp. PhB143]ROS73324.1 PhzF family phenazine biosynthesis protein [Cellulomonas sp. PhB143]
MSTERVEPPAPHDPTGRSVPFRQVDVFTAVPYRGNPLAVVQDARSLTDEQMAAFARWTNLSETTFLLPPTPEGTARGADYRVRIFTPGGELPFAGHPTLGTAHAWLEAGGVPADGAAVVQECGVGLVRVRREPGAGRLAFAAPEPTTDEPLDEATLATVVASLGIAADDVVGHRFLDNGPGWRFVLLRTAQQVLDLVPDVAVMGDLKVGVVGPWPDAAPGGPAFEVRAFVPGIGIPEDPVTGSLNAVLAQWMVREGHAPGAYVAAQGTALGRAGRVHVESDADGTVWVGGDVVTCVEGTVRTA